MRSQYQAWLGSDAPTSTAGGNLRAATRREVATWVVEAWKRLDTDMIAKSFLTCGLTNSHAGDQDTSIQCFKGDEQALDALKQGRLRGEALLEEDDPFMFEVESAADPDVSDGDEEVDIGQ